MQYLTSSFTFPPRPPAIRGSFQQTLVAAVLLCLTCISFAAESGVAQAQIPLALHPDQPHVYSPISKFYYTATPLPPGKPGELIRSEEFDGYNLPMAVSAVRLLYHSLSANNNDVAVSAVALFPDGKPPTGGWPVIAWAHEVNGVARDCAPSLARDLPHAPFLAMYVQLGYAVVATDYAGLGTNSRNAFADVFSNASDVIYAVAAAREALPKLGSKWIAMGTGEGAAAVVEVAELQQQIHDSSFLGGITLSSLIDLEDLYATPNRHSSKLPLFLAYGIKTVFPQFEVKDILTDKALSLYPRIEQTCSDTRGVPELSAAEMLKPDWQGNAIVQDYLKQSIVGLKPATAPLLVISSESDPLIKETNKIVNRLCKLSDHVQFKKYPESDPGRVVGDSTRDQIAWIQGRFAKRPAPSNCSQ